MSNTQANYTQDQIYNVANGALRQWNGADVLDLNELLHDHAGGDEELAGLGALCLAGSVGKLHLDRAEAFEKGWMECLRAVLAVLDSQRMSMSVGPGATRRDEWYVLGWADSRTKALQVVNALKPLAPAPGGEGGPR